MTSGTSSPTLLGLVDNICREIGRLESVIPDSGSQDLVTSTEYLSDIPEEDRARLRSFSTELPAQYEDVKDRLVAAMRRLDYPIMRLQQQMRDLEYLKGQVEEHGRRNAEAISLRSRLTAAIASRDTFTISAIKEEVETLDCKLRIDEPTQRLIQNMLTQIGQVLAATRQPAVEEKEEKQTPPSSPQLAAAPEPSTPPASASDWKEFGAWIRSTSAALRAIPQPQPKEKTPPASPRAATAPLPSAPQIDVSPLLDVSPLPFVVVNLDQLVRLLEKKNDEGFLEAVSFINESGLNKEGPFEAFDKIAFFLYHIHRVESTSKLDGSLDYGTRAFQTEHASPEEKLRAVQRALVLVLMTGMSGALKMYSPFEHREQPAINEYLDILSRLNLDPKDLPQGKKNLTHYLYEKLYNVYKAEAEKEGSGLRHPHDPAYRFEFGRNAFRGEVDPSAAIDKRFLNEVIDQVRKELYNDVWQIPEDK